MKKEQKSRILKVVLILAVAAVVLLCAIPYAIGYCRGFVEGFSSYG